MPQFDFPFPRRYNSLRLLGYGYNSSWQLCAISLVTELRRPLFADINMAKSVLRCLLSSQTLEHMRLRAFTLMPNHLHFIAGVRESEKTLPNLIGVFKSYSTQQYWKRGREIIKSGQVILPSTCVSKSDPDENYPVIASLMEWRTTLRPEVVQLKNWPCVKPEHFWKKRLWQTSMFDHVIRNDFDLRENMDYIAMNPVREGYVTVPQFYPYTGFLLWGRPSVAGPTGP